MLNNSRRNALHGDSQTLVCRLRVCADVHFGTVSHQSTALLRANSFFVAPGGERPPEGHPADFRKTQLLARRPDVIAQNLLGTFRPAIHAGKNEILWTSLR